MRIKLNFKTPDVIDYALEDVEIDREGREDYEIEDIMLSLKSKISRHLKYGECLTVYYNTETDKLELE